MSSVSPADLRAGESQRRILLEELRDRVPLGGGLVWLGILQCRGHGCLGIYNALGGRRRTRTSAARCAPRRHGRLEARYSLGLRAGQDLRSPSRPRPCACWCGDAEARAGAQRDRSRLAGRDRRNAELELDRVDLTLIRLHGPSTYMPTVPADEAAIGLCARAGAAGREKGATLSLATTSTKFWNAAFRASLVRSSAPSLR